MTESATTLSRTAPPPGDLSAQQIRSAIDWAIVTRRSVRAYLSASVAREEVEAILDVARHAASGTNMQPWYVHVVMNESRARLSAAISRAYDDEEFDLELTEPYAYYPLTWSQPFLDRRRRVGWALYGMLGITKTDKARMHAQHRRNFRFFDAPVGLFFTIDASMSEGSFIDCGMFVQNVMLAARARGLDTCAQVAFTKYHTIIAAELSIPANQRLVCGMSLGYGDLSQAENKLVTEREPVAAFAAFHT